MKTQIDFCLRSLARALVLFTLLELFAGILPATARAGDVRARAGTTTAEEGRAPLPRSAIRPSCATFS